MADTDNVVGAEGPGLLIDTGRGGGGGGGRYWRQGLVWIGGCVCGHKGSHIIRDNVVMNIS